MMADPSPVLMFTTCAVDVDLMRSDSKTSTIMADPVAFVAKLCAILSCIGVEDGNDAIPALLIRTSTFCAISC